MLGVASRRVGRARFLHTLGVGKPIATAVGLRQCEDMGHEVVIYGMIDGPTNGGDRHRLLERRNAAAIAALPVDDSWPWLIRAHFSLPERAPEQKYRSQVIHFGLSLKDAPPLCDSSEYDKAEGWPPEHRECVTTWITKFNDLLRTMYWFGANLHITTEFEPDRLFRYTPTTDAIQRMVADEPQPIANWEVHVIHTSR